MESSKKNHVEPTSEREAQVEELKAQIEVDKARIKELKAQRVVDKAQIKELKLKMEKLEAQVEELKAQVEEFKAQTEELKVQTEELKSQTEELKAQTKHHDEGRLKLFRANILVDLVKKVFVDLKLDFPGKLDEVKDTKKTKTALAARSLNQQQLEIFFKDKGKTFGPQYFKVLQNITQVCQSNNLSTSK